ncbi:MAG: ATP synthase F0 subunit C [Acidobacteriia bacterium]|nr:ATP synthase F0 subunit C [Terriglobia bacterium]
MTKKFLILLAMFLLASLVLCAQTPPAGTPNNPTSEGHWVVISAGFAMAIASSLCGLAQGKAIASAVEGMARNPGAAKAIQLAMLIGLAFIESLALYTLLIVFVKVK